MPRARLVVAMSLAGVRGAVTLAGIFTLPVLLTDGSPFPSRDLAIVLAAGVIVFSLVIASLLLPPMLRGLDFAEPSREGSEDRARVIAAEAAIHAVEAAASDEREATVKAGLSIVDYYRERIARASQRIEASTDAEEVAADERKLWLTALSAERGAVLALRRRHAIDDRTLQKLVREIDLTEARYSGRA
jgi:CPA1 family monovalent cation:H+ antiporter